MGIKPRRPFPLPSGHMIICFQDFPGPPAMDAPATEDPDPRSKFLSQRIAAYLIHQSKNVCIIYIYLYIILYIIYILYEKFYQFSNSDGGNNSTNIRFKT